ncbi:E3 ubiquitin-protein ligase mib1-like [Mytilus galloprovincialis]|uniref:E3 ubiquitin-protein ligase mib1-like n=1 Tax=Mytilus galloprovincialis TaxID=29158 RepID=UPI003F7C8DF7
MDADLDTENSDRLNKDLIEAAKNGDIKAVSKCLQKGALINYVDQSDNLTALHCASANGHKTIVSVLLDNGADLNDSTPDGWSILHTAALYGHKEIVSELLDRGSNPNAITRTFGVSVLYCAVQNGQKEIVAELLHNGCDPSRLMDYLRK